MAQINTNYQNIKESYLFADISNKVSAYKSANPDADIIRLGIGDVTRPLAPAVIEALHSAVEDMADGASFKGYGPEQGYDFLKLALVDYYKNRAVTLDKDEIFISDGAKSDLGNILDIFGKNNVVLVPDPVYPVYVDTNTMDGRKIVFLDGNEENNFLPLPDDSINADIIYLCSPNNPTGAVYNKAQLEKWVEYANKKDAVILFDAAYECFVNDPELPKSIYEIEGSRSCAIEFCSLSKTAGFTGTRCGYTIVPFDLIKGGQSLNKMWLRRQTTKFNGCSYITQKGAAAVFSAEGQAQVKANIDYYKQNAKIITDTLDELGIRYTGGKHSPYIWLKCPMGMDSWQFFDFLLEKANVVGTPGEGFGENGKEFFRLTSFNTHEKTKEAMERLKKVIG